MYDCSPWLLYTSMFGSLGIFLVLMWKARSTPLNYGLLALFTLMESHLVGTIGKSYQNYVSIPSVALRYTLLLLLVTLYDQKLVMQALIITFGVFFGLTIFTLQSKWDFSGMAPL